MLEDSLDLLLPLQSAHPFFVPALKLAVDALLARAAASMEQGAFAAAELRLDDAIQRLVDARARSQHPGSSSHKSTPLLTLDQLLGDAWTMKGRLPMKFGDRYGMSRKLSHLNPPQLHVIVTFTLACVVMFFGFDIPQNSHRPLPKCKLVQP
jgi:hypothetical protein